MNLSLLNPLFLWALPLAALPLVLHLLFRQKPRALMFSALTFIKRASQKNLPRSRLRNLLLALIRSMIVLALIMLFSRPMFHVGTPLKEGRENVRSMVLVLDSSYSMGLQMGDMSFFDRAKDAAFSIIDALRDTDRAGLVVFSDRIEFASAQLTNNRVELKTQLKNSSVSAHPTDVFPALDTAFRLLQGAPAQNKIIVIFSDFTRNGWEKVEKDSSFEKSPWYDPQVKCILAGLPQGVKNCAVTGLAVTGGYAGSDVSIEASVQNFLEKFENHGLGIYLRGVKKSEISFAIGRGEKSSKVFTVKPSDEPALELYARLQADALAADNSYYALGELEPPIRALLIDGDPQLATAKGETYYLRLALAPGERRAGMRIETIAQDELAARDLRAFQLVIACNAAGFDAAQAASLARYLQGGGKVIFTLGNKVDREQYARIADIFPAELVSLKVVPEGAVLRAPEPKESFIDSLDGKSYEYGEILFYSYYLTRGLFGSRTLLSLENGHPLLVEKDVGLGKSAVFCSSIDRDWTNFPVKPLYPVFLQELARYFLKGEERFLKRRAWTVGEAMTARDFNRAADIEKAVMTEPDGSTVDVGKSLKSFREVVLTKPGFSTLAVQALGKRTSERFAVNLSQLGSEGSYETVPVAEINKLFPRSAMNMLALDEHFVRKLFGLLEGIEVSGYLLWGLLALLIGELLLANPKPKT